MISSAGEGESNQKRMQSDHSDHSVHTLEQDQRKNTEYYCDFTLQSVFK